MNEEYQREQIQKRSKEANVRVAMRRASEGMIGVIFPMEDYHNELQEVMDLRQAAVEEAFELNEEGDEEVYRGLPIQMERLYYSFIWDRYGNLEIDQAAMLDAGIRIDPTNKNLNLEEEIKKLV